MMTRSPVCLVVGYLDLNSSFQSTESMCMKQVYRRSSGRFEAEGHDPESVFFMFGGEVCKFVLVAVTNGDLMIPAPSIEADEEEFPSGIAEIINGILTARDWVFKGKSDAVELAVGDAHAPDEIVNIGDVFLVRLRRKDNERTPWPVAFPDPAISEENLLLFKNYLRLVRSVTGLATADGLRAARVNGELEAKDSFADAGFVEDVPILLYHHFNFTARCQSNMGADADMLLELGLVPGTVPEVDVSARGGDGSWNTANRIAILGEDKKVVVDVVPIVERNVTIGRLRAPDFGRDIDHERVRQSGCI